MLPKIETCAKCGTPVKVYPLMNDRFACECPTLDCLQQEEERSTRRYAIVAWNLEQQRRKAASAAGSEEDHG